SRRRHTRLVSDWSSDVCSSDLAAEQPGARVLSVDPSLTRPRPDQLGALAPLAGFSAGRLAELAQVAVVERAPRGSDPLRDRLEGPQSVFLLAGELLLAFEGGGTLVVVGASDEARQALNRQGGRVARSKAITDGGLVILEDEVVDILATWDQVAAGADS